MKKIKTLKLIAAGLFLVAALSGCGTFGGLFTATPQVQTYYEPHQVIQQVTNQDGSVVSVTNTTLIPRQVTNGMTYAVSSSTANIISAAQSAGGLLPPPYGTALTGGLTVLSGILGFIANLKSKQLGVAQPLADMVEPMIAGVEQGNDPATKQAIKSNAIGAGVQDDLDKKVQAVTNKMPVKHARAAQAATKKANP
jgi:hypothetical protein